jgi:prepilin signal peptidase PulO-like enzyme (type II secretory pathway)
MLNVRPKPSVGIAMSSVIIGFLILAVIVMAVFHVTFWAAVAIIVAGIVVYAMLNIFLSFARRRQYRDALLQKRNALLRKYGDQTIVERIMSGDVWQGMTRDQLIDCLGQPLAIDQKVEGHKSTEICKYDQDGANRFRLRVSIKDDVVVGWQRRGE